MGQQGETAMAGGEIVEADQHAGAPADPEAVGDQFRYNMKVIVRIMVGRCVKERVCNIDSTATLGDLCVTCLEVTRDCVGTSEKLPTYKLVLPTITSVLEANIGQGTKVTVNSV